MSVRSPRVKLWIVCLLIASLSGASCDNSASTSPAQQEFKSGKLAEGIAQYYVDSDENGRLDQRSIRITDGDWADVEVIFYDQDEDGQPEVYQIVTQVMRGRPHAINLVYGPSEIADGASIVSASIAPAGGEYGVQYRDLDLDGHWDQKRDLKGRQLYVRMDGAWVEYEITMNGQDEEVVLKDEQTQVRFIDGNWQRLE